jgi:hypothetical protein
MINDSNGTELHNVEASSMNADPEIERLAQLSILDYESRARIQPTIWRRQRRSGDSVCDGGCVGKISD